MKLKLNSAALMNQPQHFGLKPKTLYTMAQLRFSVSINDIANSRKVVVEQVGPEFLSRLVDQLTFSWQRRVVFCFWPFFTRRRLVPAGLLLEIVHQLISSNHSPSLPSRLLIKGSVSQLQNG